VGRTAKFSLLSALFFCALQAQDSGTVEGSVVDSATGTGLAEVTVYFGSDQGAHYDATTDASGKFQIGGMKDGQYGSHFEKAGYVSQFSGTNDSVLNPVRIAARQDPVRLRIELVALASVRGRVLDPDGKPVANLTVTLGRATETTNGQGQFAFTKLAPGSYTLHASPDSSGAHPVQTPVEDRTEFVPTWFPSAVESDLAEHITVRGGGNLSGYEIRLRTAPVYRVRGVVLGENGKPAPHAVVRNAPDAEQSVSLALVGVGKSLKGGPLGYFLAFRSGMVFGGDGLSAYEGVFEFPSVPRGLRRFTASIESEDTAVPRAPEPVTVSVVVDRDIDDLQIRFGAPFALDGSVELTGASAAVTPEAVRSAFVSLLGSGRTTKVKSDSGFRFENVMAGEYRISAAPGVAGGYYLASISLGGQDVTGRPVSLQAGSPPIHVVYKPNAGTVSGTVDTMGSREDAEGGTVVLIPQSALDSLAVDFGRACAIGPGGAFEIESVGPGSYYAFAVNRLDPEKFFDPRIARKIASNAALVQVAEGSAVSIKVNTIRLEE
jgi:hypothetical protein